MGERERSPFSLLCFLLGHDWYSDLTWDLTNNSTHRTIHGDVCRRCNSFKPRGAGSAEPREERKEVGQFDV
jgi:hypothetical protein